MTSPTKAKILLVDDDRDICETLSDILETENYDVTYVLDGFQALDILAKEKFDVVLMDIRMPGINGVETFKKLKPIAPETPVIMVSAYAVEDLIKEAIREGAFATLQKPVDFDVLVKNIESARNRGALVLVVDDEPHACEMMRTVLSRKGYRVETASSGQEAIDKASLYRFDIIILDMDLPVINGLEVFLSIKDIRPDAIVILVTGHYEQMEDKIREAVEKGVYSYLQKPFNPEILLRIMDDIDKRKN